jgi:hypothetical protein
MYNTNNIPIILVHQGNSDYLKYALHQAKLFNQNSTIFLIGDNSNDKYDIFLSY